MLYRGGPCPKDGGFLRDAGVEAFGGVEPDVGLLEVVYWSTNLLMNATTLARCGKPSGNVGLYSIVLKIDSAVFKIRIFSEAKVKALEYLSLFL